MTVVEPLADFAAIEIVEIAHCLRVAASDVAREHRAESVLPYPYCFTTKVDTAREKQVFDIPEQKREAIVHPYHQSVHLW